MSYHNVKILEAADREYFNTRRQKRRQKYIDLLGGKCERCGSKKNLHFDHKQPKKKEFRIADKIDAPEDVLMAEVKKCRLLCDKCHRDKTREKGEHGQNTRRHGTLHMYRNCGCRCKKCRQAVSEYNRQKRMDRLAELYLIGITKISASKVFTFIPKTALPYIQELGILSGKELLNYPDVIKKTFPDTWENKTSEIKENLKDPDWKDIQSGISAFLTLPDWDKLPEDHFIFDKDLVPITINLEKLISQNPEIKILGVELTPELIDDRERYLSIPEIEELQQKGSSKLWEHYQADSGKYAPNVPHIVIMTSQIDPEFINV